MVNRIPQLAALAFLLGALPVLAGEYPCEDPPYYSLGEEVYAGSPTPQMAFMHDVIGVFQGLFRTEQSPHPLADSTAWRANRPLLTIENTQISGVPVTILTPRGLRNDKIILYLHGGAYSQEMIFPQWEMVADIAIKAGSPVYVVDYRLVPEYTFPAPIEDGLAVYLQLLQDISADRIVFMGDSAGGGLALGLAGKLRDDALPLPAQLVLISPWLDIAGDDPGMPALDDLDQMLSVDDIQSGGMAYAGGDPGVLDNPYASPLLLNDLDELPPTILFVGTHEILYPESLAFRDKAENQGMDLTYVAVEGGFHVFLGAPALLVPESARARRQVASFINCLPDGGRLEGSETNGALPLHLHPNPVAGQAPVYIAVPQQPDSEGTTATLTITDMQGQVVHKQTGLDLHSGPVVAGAPLLPGLYRVTLSGARVWQAQLVVVR